MNESANIDLKSFQMSKQHFWGSKLTIFRYTEKEEDPVVDFSFWSH